MKKNLHHRADFLNQPFFHSDATIYSHITDEEGHRFGWDGVLKIRDCNETVSLYIDAGTQEELENTIYKLNTLIDHLTELRTALIKHGPDHVKFLEAEREKDKTKNDD